MENLVFYIFAGLALIAASMVVTLKNPVRAVLSLIATFFATSITWLYLDAEFLALSLVLVYVGAVMVLFLFVVMMLDINYATLQIGFSRWLPIGVAMVAVLLAIIYKIFADTNFNVVAGNNLAYSNKLSNTAQLGTLIFTEYLLQFEIAGVILLVAIIAAIALIYRGPRARKVQNIAQQISVQPKDRVRLVEGN